MQEQLYPFDDDGEAVHATEPLRIVLELEGDDPTFISAASLEVVSALQREGYQVEPVYTGQRGGGLLVEVGVMMGQALELVKVHHALISEGIQDLGELGIFAALVPLCKSIAHAVTKRAQAKGAVTHLPASISISIEIDGHPIYVEATDLEQAEAALLLARRFAVAHPAIARQASAKQSKVKVKGQMTRPPQAKRGHHR